MSRSDDQRVADILDAAGELAIVTEVGRDAFASSPLHIRAAERLLEIIGEASNTLTDDFKTNHSEIAWRDISALRILLAHHYHRIDVDQVWEIATSAVPQPRPPTAATVTAPVAPNRNAQVRRTARHKSLW